MSNVISIKGFRASVEFHNDRLVGRFLDTSEKVEFFGASVADIKYAGEDALEAFLKKCREENKKPVKVYTGRLRVNISPELEEKVQIFAKAKHKSVSDIVTFALQSYMKL